MNKKYRSKAFTLVEVLICVGIIGIIAAITIPALLSSTSEKALEAQRKALYSRMAQAFGQISNLKLYEVSTANSDGTTYTDSYSALNFITSGLSKVFRLTDTCDSSSIRECGVPDTVIDYYSETDTDTYTIIDKITLASDGSGAATSTALNEKITKADLGGLNANYAAFRTANGESILMWYNPKCKTKKQSEYNLAHSVCVNMIYDLNGRNNAPNTYGEDIGYITVFYPTDSVVAMPILYNKKVFDASSHDNMLATASDNELNPPTIEELISILVNKNIAHITKDIDTTQEFWSSSYSSTGMSQVWTAGIENGVKLQDIEGGSTAKPYFLVKK